MPFAKARSKPRLSMSSITSNLNPSQRQAVETLEGPLLVLAGAGSGKTRILTHRIVNLIETGAAFPGEVFAVTFTNKAAAEMRHRVEKLLSTRGIPTNEIWISTFHSSGAKILRTYGDRIGLSAGFTIFDDSDQLAVVKRVLKRLDISDKIISPQQVVHKVNQLKNDAVDLRRFQASKGSYVEAKLAPILIGYEEELHANNAVDFGDLLFKTYQLFEQDAALRESFQDRYRFFLVDEYQDTNPVQYKFLKLLSAKHKNLCVVGDEDQSIYRWRGADIRNILDFEKDYPNAQVVKLEENYRSSAHIIRAANKVISNNRQRKEKVLFTSNPDGKPVEVHFLENDFEEARWVVKSLKAQLEEKHFALNETAIFYRTNAQSRLLEDSLRYDRIPYKVFGGMKFYDRAEIKDVLAYMRVLVNPRCDISLARMINVPARGIGDSTIEKIHEFAQQERLSMMEAVGAVVKGEGSLASGPRNKLKGFVDLYAKLNAQITEMSPSEFYGFMLDEIGYVKALESENTIEAAARIDNLKELASALVEYEQRSESPSLSGFLEEVALISDLDKLDESAGFVTLMTIHSAKGLEFPLVYLVGLEEDLFPSARSLQEGEDGDGVEEERRLCYVGMTRAKQQLLITAAHQRRVFGVKQIRRPSRFIDELPAGEVVVRDHSPMESYKTRSSDYGDSFGDASSFDGFGDRGDSYGGAFESPVADGYSVGAKVKHPDYGMGTILSREGQRESLKVQVKFQQAGVKKFVVKYAPLELL